MPMVGPGGGWTFSSVLRGAVSSEAVTITGGTGGDAGTAAGGRRRSIQPAAAAPAASAAASTISHPAAQPLRPG
jgi:hypothetical protein